MCGKELRKQLFLGILIVVKTHKKMLLYSMAEKRRNSMENYLVNRKQKRLYSTKIKCIILSAILLFAGIVTYFLWSFSNEITAQIFSEEDIQRLASAEVEKAEEGIQEYIKNYITENNISNFYTDADIDKIKEISAQAVTEGLESANISLSENQTVEITDIVNNRISDAIIQIENNIPAIVQGLALSDTQRSEVERMIKDAIKETAPAVVTENGGMSEDEKNSLRESILAECRALMSENINSTNSMSQSSWTLSNTEIQNIAELVKQNLNLSEEVKNIVGDVTIDEEIIISRITENISSQLSKNIFDFLTDEDIDKIKQNILETISTDISNLNTQVVDLQAQTANINTQITGINEEIANLKSKIESANMNDIADLKKKLETAEGKLASLENNLEMLNNAKDDIIQSAEEEAAKRENADNVILEKITAVETKSVELADQITNAFTEITSLQEQIKNANANEIADLQTRLKAAEEKLIITETSIQELIIEKENIKQSISDETGERIKNENVLNTKITNVETNVNSLLSEIGIVKTALDTETDDRINGDKALQTQINSLNSNLTEKINNVQSQIPTRPISQQPSINDCLLETTEAGYYQYNSKAANKPSNVDGIIIVYPWFSKNTDSHPTFSVRIAIDTNGEIYTSIYTFGVSYGSWMKQ